MVKIKKWEGEKQNKFHLKSLRGRAKPKYLLLDPVHMRADGRKADKSVFSTCEKLNI